jgi:hypothetical protein
MEDLKRSGFTQEQAIGITQATAKALGQMIDAKQLTTKTDISDIKQILAQMEIGLSKMELRIYKIIFSMFVAFGFIQHFLK